MLTKTTKPKDTLFSLQHPLTSTILILQFFYSPYKMMHDNIKGYRQQHYAFLIDLAYMVNFNLALHILLDALNHKMHI